MVKLMKFFFSSLNVCKVAQVKSLKVDFFISLPGMFHLFLTMTWPSQSKVSDEFNIETLSLK